jgi:hypothetical protein
MHEHHREYRPRGRNCHAVVEYPFDRQDCAAAIVIGYIEELGNGDMDMRDFDGPLGFHLPGLGLALF